MGSEIPRLYLITDQKSPSPDSEHLQTEQARKGRELLNNLNIQHILLDNQSESWPNGEIIGQICNRTTPRFAYLLTQQNKENDSQSPIKNKKEWLKIASDGDKIIITKDNHYYKVIDPTKIGLEKTQEKIQAIIDRDTLRRKNKKQSIIKKVNIETFEMPIVRTVHLQTNPPKLSEHNFEY